MRLLLLGASGSTGKQLLPQPLEAGHEVTVIARQPERVPSPSDRLTVRPGSVTDAALMDAVLPHHHAVISVLGTRRSPRGFGSFNLMTKTMDAVVPAMQRHGVQRLLLLSALGVGETAGVAPPMLRILFGTVLRPVGRDKAASEAHVRQSGLDWTFVYPPLLGNGPLTGEYRHGEALRVQGLKKIARADVAHFMLAQLEGSAYSRNNAIVSS